MKRYKFPLGAVLTVRRRAEDSAYEQLSAAQRQERESRMTAQRAEERIAATVVAVGESDVDAFLADRELMRLRAGALASAHADLEAARAVTAARTAAYQRAIAERRALEKLDERLAAEHAAAAAHAEAKELDDLVVSRHGWSSS